VAAAVVAGLLIHGHLRSTVPEDAPTIGLSLDRFWLNQIGVTRPLFDQALARVGARLVVLAPTAGGEPVDSARVRALVASVDGIILGGGGDVDPALYGGDPESAAMVDRLCDNFQLELITHARSQETPILGICRGLQLINVAHGGTLRSLGFDADLEDRHFLNFAGHDLHIEAESSLAEIMGGVLFSKIMSTHRQGLDLIGDGLRPVAWADAHRTEVEAVEAVDGSWMIAVMWHPERESIDDDRHLAPFHALARAARSRATGR
jgi:putative glutamine amidotransferase